MSGRSCLACSRLDRLAGGGTAALAAWELTDRQGRLDYITTPVPSLWHLTAARASRVGHWLLISAQGHHQPCGRSRLPGRSTDVRAPPHLTHHTKLVSRFEWHWPNIGNSDCSRWNQNCDVEASIPYSGTPIRIDLTLSQTRSTESKLLDRATTNKGQVASTPKPPSWRRAPQRSLFDSCQAKDRPRLEMLRDSTLAGQGGRSALARACWAPQSAPHVA